MKAKQIDHGRTLELTRQMEKVSEVNLLGEED